MTTLAHAGHATMAAVSAKDLVKVYGTGDTAVRALDGVTVGFDRARFTAIMGPSGSGKSTLMHCLAGLDRATSGAALLGGTDLTTQSDRVLTRVSRPATWTPAPAPRCWASCGTLCASSARPS
jgi:putative ABC transport system ATP-binding protein